MLVRPTLSATLSRTEPEEALAEASVALHMARVDALLGRRFDTEEYDALLMRYRTAKHQADIVRTLLASHLSRAFAA